MAAQIAARFDVLRTGHRMVLVIGPRRERFGDGFERISTALWRVAARIPDVDFVYPMHLNPNVREGVPGLREILHP